jgi:hypothetical protein
MTTNPDTTNTPDHYLEEATVDDTNDRPFPYTQESLRLQDVQSFQAITNRINHRQELLDSIYNQDEAERYSHETHYRSTYDRHCTIQSWTSDTDIERFWFNTTAHDIDDTNKIPFYVAPPNTTENPNSEFYTTPPSEYRIVTTNLTPHATTRQYGRVFFSTVTRYVPHDAYYYPRRKHTNVRGYLREGNRRIYCPTYTHPHRGVLYTTQGILKLPTALGYIVDTILNNLNILRTYSTAVWNPYSNSIALRYFDDLRDRYNFQIDDWARNIVRLEPPGITYSQRSLSHTLEYYFHWHRFTSHIEQRLSTDRLEFKYACVRIQRFWRAKTKFYTLLQINTQLNTLWRNYIFRNFGSRFTILSDNNIDSLPQHVSTIIIEPTSLPITQSLRIKTILTLLTILFLAISIFSYWLKQHDDR